MPFSFFYGLCNLVYGGVPVAAGQAVALRPLFSTISRRRARSGSGKDGSCLCKAMAEWVPYKPKRMFTSNLVKPAFS